MEKKPAKCAKRKFQGKCRKACDKHWGPISEIEFCDGPAWPGSKEELLAKMRRRRTGRLARRELWSGGTIRLQLRSGPR